MFSSNTSQVSADANWIEECFSTHLYQGNDSTQTITNGIDLSGNGGLVWSKGRSVAAFHVLIDTNRGASSQLFSNTTGAAQTGTDLSSFSSTGYVLGAPNNANINANASTYASWTFRKQPKFFDVVTYTGTGANRAVAHNLGSVPGCMIVKRTDSTGSWAIYHRSLGGTQNLLFTTAAATSISTVWNNTDPTSTEFSVGTNGATNANGGTYVAYLFAHNAGGFGLTGTDNVISCGSFTTDGSGNATVSLGYEPQWVLIKQTDGVDSWYLNDNMRGMAVSGNQPNLSPNSSAAESAGGYNTYPNATGFTASVGIASKNYIYIAIRRGPMKTPTTGTSVYGAVARTGTGTSNTILSNSGFTDDAVITKRSSAVDNNWVGTRLIGGQLNLVTDSTSAEFGSAFWQGWDTQTGMRFTGDQNVLSASYIDWHFRRAPGFFDVVCYTGTGGFQTVSHNLGVAPELVIFKGRGSPATNWITLVSSLSKFGYLNNTLAVDNDPVTYFTTNGSTYAAPTATSLFLNNLNVSNYVAYLFASCPGVSKVGSYTGTGTTKQIDCGFTGGARFVLIKRTDSTGDWYVWDSARGIVSGNDPYLLLNSTAAEVTNTDYVDTYSAGFEISSTAPAAINANGGSFIFLAIA